MNSLIKEINKLYDNKCYINTDKEKLKFRITFINEDNDEEEEGEKAGEEKYKKEEEDEEDNVEVEDVKNNIKDCIMKVKLYYCGNDEYLLCFEKNQGNLEEFYDNFLKIKEIISKVDLFN